MKFLLSFFLFFFNVEVLTGYERFIIEPESLHINIFICNMIHIFLLKGVFIVAEIVEHISQMASKFSF